MRVVPWLAQYAIAAVVFCVLDVIWLGTLAQGLYADLLGDLRADEPNLAAAAIFYAIFLAGLVYFVISPAIASQSWRRAVFAGGFFGLVTYATWDLTNLAVIRDFPVAVVPIDLAWGTFLSATVSVTTYAACRWLPPWAR